MKDVFKRSDKMEDKRSLQASTLDLGYETSYHNSALDISDEANDTGQNGKMTGKKYIYTGYQVFVFKKCLLPF